MGADGIESDVHLSKEKIPIFFHDDKVEFQGRVVTPSSLTLKKLRSINLKNERKIPTVEEVFHYFKNKTTEQGEPIRYSLDLKTLDMGFQVIKLAEEIGIAEFVELTPNDNYLTFWKYIAEFRKQSNKIQIVDSAHFDFEWLKKLFGKMYYQNWEKFREFGLKGVNLKADRATDEAIGRIKAHGLIVYVWDCHTHEKIKTFCQKNVDALYTNYPDVAVKARNEQYSQAY